MSLLQADLPLLEADFLATVLHDIEFSEEASLQLLCMDDADGLLTLFDTAILCRINLIDYIFRSVFWRCYP